MTGSLHYLLQIEAFYILLVSGAYVFSETLTKLSWLNFGKIRLVMQKWVVMEMYHLYSDQLFYGVNANLINNPSGTSVAVGYQWNIHT